MKTRLLCTFGALLLAVVSLHAQGVSTVLTANVPFDFQAGSAALPAGVYSVDLRTAGMVRLISADRKSAAIIPTMGKETLKYNETSKLIFNRYGESYFLSQVWGPGLSGREIAKSRREKEAAFAATHSAKQTLVATVAK